MPKHGGQNFYYGLLILMLLGTTAGLMVLSHDFWSQHSLFASTPLWGKLLLFIIVLLGGFGLFLQALLFFRYHLDARILDECREVPDSWETASERSLVGQRVGLLRSFDGQHDLDALADLTAEAEQERLMLPRYIQNILILLGVFGTMTSLGLALGGAADILNSGGGTEGIGQLIGGMSTALTTTMLAIIGFLPHSFFFTVLQQKQQQILRSLEIYTARTLVCLAPEKAAETAVDNQAAMLLEGMQLLVGQLSSLVKPLEAAQDQLLRAHREALAAHQELAGNYDALQAAQRDNDQYRFASLSLLREIRANLEKGFRLDPPNQDLVT